MIRQLWHDITTTLPHLTPFSRFTDDPGYLSDRSDAEPHGMSVLVCVPHADHVAPLVRLAAQYGVPVVPRGGGSGLSGGAVPLRPSLVIDLSDLTAITELDPVSRTAQVGPGITLEHLGEELAQHGLMYPPDPASVAVATLGGTVATNAGGLRCVKYGVTRAWIRTLDVVWPDGTRSTVGHPTVKDVTGLSLLHLMIGSEGTLGIVVGVGISCAPLPAVVHTALVACPTVQDAGNAVHQLLASTVPSMCELMDAGSLRVLDTSSVVSLLGPLTSWGDDPTLLIVQFDGWGADAELAHASTGLASAGTRLAPVPEHLVPQVLAMRRGRHSSNAAVPPRDHGSRETTQDVGAGETSISNSDHGGYPLLEESMVAPVDRVHSRGQDVAVPLREVVRVIEHTRRIAQEAGIDSRVIAHAGDGNLHPLFLIPKDRMSAAEAAPVLHDAMQQLVDLVLELRGTVTGEHGVGSLKRAWAQQDVGETLTQLQARVQRAFDPAGIMNPGKGF